MQRENELTAGELADIARRRRIARAKARRLIESADPTEDAAVVAAAESDPDALPMTDEQLARMRLAHEVLPGLVAKHLRGRPKLASPKRQVTLRIDADVLEHFKAGGSGWQTAMNHVLRKAVEKRGREATAARSKPRSKTS